MKRGRQSGASLAVMTPVSARRLAPTKGLAPAASAHWLAGVGAWPPGHFSAKDAPLLAMLSKTMAESDWIERQLAEADDLAHLKALYGLLDKSRARSAQCLRALRITKLAQTDSRAAGRAAATGDRPPAPWETPQDDDADDEDEGEA